MIRASLGFLAGLGWTAKKIADDPLIRSTPNNVYRQAARFGIALSDGPQGHVSVRLPVANMAVVDRAAAALEITHNNHVRRRKIAAKPQRCCRLILVPVMVTSWIRTRTACLGRDHGSRAA